MLSVKPVWMLQEAAIDGRKRPKNREIAEPLSGFWGKMRDWPEGGLGILAI
jgi:hypothetical protein